jgi:diacylglycerol kinase family enzyme
LEYRYSKAHIKDKKEIVKRTMKKTITQMRQKTAVILNENARRVNSRVVKRITAVVGEENVYYTKTLGEVEGAVDDILEKRFDLLFCGGGDGTIVGVISAVKTTVERIAERGEQVPIPTIGILKMGTGNAWAYAVGVKGGLKQIGHVTCGGGHSVVSFDLLKVKDRICSFAGIGADAQVLNDYYDLLERLGNSRLKKRVVGLNGYIYSSITRSIPAVRAMTKGGAVPEVEVRLTGKKLFRPSVDAHPVVVDDMKGEVIFRGRANIVACGTIPYFGYAFRAFPFAEAMPGTMHLRVAHVTAGEAVRNLRGLWKGTYVGSGFSDFLTDGVNIKFDREMPLEVGGDPHGYTTEVDFEVPDFTVDVVSHKDKKKDD